jgi:hypothetical protein
MTRTTSSMKRISYREWNCTKALEEGSVVCFTNEDGLPLKVARHSSQKYWELVPTNILDKDETPILPPECAFAVLKDDAGRYGFRSLVAGGRLLQATKNKRDPPRVTNFNFGPWETWQLTSDALKNCAWKTDLPWNMSELRVQVLSILHELELKQRNEHRELRRALLQTEEKREEMEGHLKHAIQTCQKQMEFATQQTDDLQARLAESLATSECLSTEVMEYQEINKRAHGTIERLTKDRDMLEAKERDFRLRSEVLEQEMAQERIKSKEKMDRISAKLKSENKKLRKNMEVRLSEVEEENEGLRKALDSIASKISQFSAKNTPVSVKVKSVTNNNEEEETLLEAADSGPCSSIGKMSDNDNDSSVQSTNEDDEYTLDGADYPVDKTLEEESRHKHERVSSLLMSSMENEDSIRMQESIAKEDLQESPEIDPDQEQSYLPLMESPVQSNLINLDSPLYSTYSQKSVSTKLVDTEGVASSPKSEPSASMVFSISDTSLDQMQREEDHSSTSHVVETHVLQEDSFRADDDAEYGEEDSLAVVGKGKAAVNAREHKELSKISKTTKTAAGGKRVAPTMFSRGEEADYESEDWWNSFTMQTSI